MVVNAIAVTALSVHLARVGSAGLASRLSELAHQVAADLESETRANVSSRMKVRSRQLLTSVRGDVEETPDQMDVRISAGGDAEGLGVAYARIQELGGIVRPIRGKYLAIPVGPALVGPGVARAPSPRLVPGLAFAQSLKGQPLLLKEKTGEVWFLLRKQVVIRPKSYLQDALETVAARVPGELAVAAAAAVAP